MTQNPPLWIPSEAYKQSTKLHAFIQRIEEKTGKNFPEYHDFYTWSVENQETFWDEFWDFAGIIGEKGSTVLTMGAHMTDARFFPEAKMNYAENMLRRKDDKPAIIFRDEQGLERSMSYEDLYHQVSKLQQFLKNQGVGKGDRVAGYMPNLPETIIAHLATASLGAIWCSASPDFGAQGLLDRFGQIEPKVLIAANGYYYNGKTLNCMDKVAEIAPQLKGLKSIVIIDFVTLSSRPERSGAEGSPEAGVERYSWRSLGFARDDIEVVGYDEIQTKYPAQAVTFERVVFNHPLVIMFSSGTTGKPKCIVHGHGGTLLQHLKEHILHCDVQQNDKIFYFTTCGWMMWNWLITGLAVEATLLLYDGSPFYPDGNVLWDYTSKHHCKLFGTSAKYIDALKANDLTPGKNFDLSDLRIITSTGSPLVHESFDYVYSEIKQDVHLASIYGGTDIISASFGLGNPLSPVYRGELQSPGLATAVDVYNSDGQPIPEGGGAGELVCTQPFISMPVEFWNDPDGNRYRGAYFEMFDNIWQHGDWAEKTKNHGLIVHGRSDATLNPGGVRIGTAEIYRQVEQIPQVLESIAVGQDWDGDVRVILFVILKSGETLTDDLVKNIKTRIRSGASPRHTPAKVIAVTDIPRTKSGKITELAVRDVIHGREVKNKTALANPEALELYEGLEDLRA